MNKIRHNFSFGDSFQNRNKNRLLNIDNESSQIFGTEAFGDNVTVASYGASLSTNYAPLLASAPDPVFTPSVAELANPAFAPQPSAAAFNPSNIVVYRVGTGAAALSSAATAVFLDEYTSAGTLAQSIALPTLTGGGRALTASGTATSEGLLTRSGDGRFLILTGYDAAVGTAAVNGTASSLVQRIVGRVDANGTVDTTSNLGTTAFSGGNVRGATSLDGTAYWVTGSVTGVVYTTHSQGASTIVSNTATNLRGIDIVDGQLYTSSGSGTLRLGAVGSGTPTATGQTITNLPGFPTTTLSPYQFYFADLTASVAGVDTVYVTDDRSVALGGGLLKFSLVGGTWVSNGTASVGLTTGLRGLAGSTSGTTVQFYATTTQTNANQIVALTDTGGYNAAFSTTTFTTVATAAVNTAFRGVAFAPQAVASPGALAINDVAAAEGNAGTTNITFTVTRSGGSSGAVSATWTLANGTSDDADFTITPQTGTVSFADGVTTATVTITIASDVTVETNETFFVNLTAPTGGATISDAQGQGTIINDDSPPVGTLSINDVAIAEGNAGTTNLVFTVTRASGSFGAVSATWTVVNGTANASDFTGALTGTVSFADGETTATVTVGITGDTVFETNETFTVTLSAPIGGVTISDGSGIGTINNDDAAPAVANVWVNEFHYDNAGTDDLNEFIEIAGLAGTDLTGWSLVLYNGNGGAVYSTLSLSGTLADQTNGFGFVKVLAPGLQNGSPDGFALVDNFGRVIQFLSYEGSMTAVGGAANGMTSTDVGVGQASAAVGFTLQLTGTGSGYAGFTWAANVANTEGAVNAGQTFLSGTDQGQISITDASVTEGNSGTRSLTFTVSRAGGFASSATVDYQVLLTGTANADDLDAAAILSGTITFAANEFTRTITVAVAGDTVGEANETLFVQLSNVTGNAVIADGTATGTIVNDDPVPLTIMQIQGASHTSAVTGQVVLTGGIVTAVDTDGFYMQHATGDGDNATSDGIFVFTTGVPTVAVGDAVSVSGTVQEFLPGTNNLTVTRIVPTSVVVDSSGNALPAAVLIGTGGRLPPTEAYDSDGFTIFNPTVDGLDFYESLEGMRVTIDAPLVVGPTTSFGETTVVASGGVGATGVNSRGGITISAGDFNPERIQIDDDSGLFAGYIPNYTQGDRLSSVTGVVSYNFISYEVLVTEAVTVTIDAPALTRNPTTLVGDADHLSMATYNVSNLDPTDTTFDLLATDIVLALRAPDILAVQEIQDADGAGTGGNLSGTVTAQKLIDAIVAAGGPTYVYIEVAPTVANTTGGEPNGNIRNGYFYNPNRVSYVAGSATAIDSAVYSGTRRPLAAQFDFNGQRILAIDVHFTSRGGSDPLTGSIQPPSNAGDAARTAQANGVATYINSQLATNPALNVAVLGDFNGFWFEDVVGNIVTRAGLNRASDLAPEEERYSYVFENNAQQIDHILLSNGLYAGAQYDAVHINAEFSAATRPSDHDPQVVLLLIPAPNAPTDLAISNDTINENNAAGAVVGTASATDRVGDVLTYSLTNTAGGLFAINATTGVITAVGPLDYEAAMSHIIVVRVTDQGGLFTEISIAINVGDVNEAPSAIADPLTINEDASSSNLYTLLLGNDFDPDDGDTITITAIGGTALGTVQFDAVARTLVYIADSNAFDPLRVGESATDSFTYTITDADGLTSTATVTVIVNGVADNPITQSGTPLDDILIGADGDDTFNGLAGNDVINGGGGVDVLNGDAGNDRLILGSAANGSTINGGADTDTLVITRSVTSLAGLIGIEALELNNGAGLTITGAQFSNGLSAFTAVSGTGTITVNMAPADVLFFSTLFSFAGNGVNLVVNGSSGSDVIKAGNTSHTIFGGDGGDQITGGSAVDTIDGGSGDDKITGRGGADILTGGAGADSFRYAFQNQSGLGSDADRITDYSIGEDRLSFSLIDTDPLTDGDQGFVFVGNGVFSSGGVASIRYSNSGADLLVQADVNGDGIADMEIVLQGLSGGTLTAGDFVL